MGIRPSMQKAMLQHLRLGGASVCELGDQFVGTRDGRQIAREWYMAQGCARYVSLDGNGLNGARAIDLNKPIALLDGPFDLVTDFGTGEHIWDQAQVWRTLHDLCKPSGHIVFDRPTQGYGGHCFYLIDRAVIAALVHFNRYQVVWIGRALTTRGELLRGIICKPDRQDKFVTPQQGRYFKHLGAISDRQARLRGADYKSKQLRTYKLVGKELPPMVDETTNKGIWE